MQYLKKIIRKANIVIILLGLLIPLILFANRFLIPDVSFDSINYHLFLGYKGVNWTNNKFEFYPTGIHNFSTILEIPGYVFSKVFGYRLGTIGSLIFLYLSIMVLYKIYRLYNSKLKILDEWWAGVMIVSIFFSFESFLQIATYYIDIEVAFLMLLSTYYLLKFEKTRKVSDLIISSISVSIFTLGKMTSWYFLFPYFGYLFYVLKGFKKNKIKFLILAGGISVLLILPWLINNFQLTGNPVFPFYNNVFKSKYFAEKNFDQFVFGGKNLMEKISWGILSAKFPERLGEVHDLFNDYKINIYFVTTIFALIWAVIKKNKLLKKLAIFYLATYLSWSYFFGYLRYGLILELFGGLILLMWMEKITKKYLIIVPIVLIMMVQGKRIVNLSLAYDISFRPGYFYNRESYKKEINNWGKNKIWIDQKISDKYKPEVYLNCALPNMTYYVVSKFNNLPVFNIDARANNDMVLNPNYAQESKRRLDGKTRFVTIAAREGLNDKYNDCINNLKDKKYTIFAEVEVDSFLGYAGQKLVYIFGEMY